MVVRLAGSPDGRLAVTATESGVRRWDPSSGRPKGELLTHPGLTRWLFSPDGRMIVTVGAGPANQEGEVRLWDAATGNRLGSRVFPQTVTGELFSPDGQSLAVLAGPEVVLWRAEAPEEPAVVAAKAPSATLPKSRGKWAAFRNSH